MKRYSSIDTDAVMYRLISQAKKSGAVTASGCVCLEDDRPTDSQAEDITVNTTYIDGTKPQEAVTNVNIYVSDRPATICRRQQLVQDRQRMADIGDALLAYLEVQTVHGLEFWVESDTVMRAADVGQHFRNIRLRWSIH